MADADDAQPSLFDRIGGRDTVAAAVDWFYLKVLNDPAVARFFCGLLNIVFRGSINMKAPTSQGSSSWAARQSAHPSRN